MTVGLGSLAEEMATRAEGLPAFGSLKLVHIKRAVADLLGLIGRDGIFDEYTVHNISHIDAMLNSLDWIIPDGTKAFMTPADWALTVLSIYFHDLGMLVTKKEFANRHASGFPAFRDMHLFDGDAGKDYRHKVSQLPQDDAERFLYQEFVRDKHAERIRAWVMGKAAESLGVTPDVVIEVNKLLETLDPQFRRDLALVCESHHLNDLNDFRKYKISQPYGNSDAETANVQYAAILLRTADLLHITRDRTPSTMFRVISPSDPISQREWAKQAAVKRVRPKSALDEEGNPNESLPRDTIEVFAYFQNEDGFFGLTSYLTYADDQLRKSFEWAQAATKTQGARHQFPWRRIDQGNIEAEGFLRRPFAFELDQTKILDLLTGHTLYNDHRIVLRELVQNSLDAIRLQRFLDGKLTAGAIKIGWNSKERVLTVWDNGTGMTQDIIERHLLKVGSSRYQDPEFRKKHPNFSPISRFGIGVLSTFMIADAVEITTCSPEEEQARQLALRSVHGRYLVRLLDKHDTRLAGLIPHGTLFRLSIRQSVDMTDVIDTLRKWIVIPGCDVTVCIDDGATVGIGFGSPKQALEDYLERLGYYSYDGARSDYKVEQRQHNGVELAYALRWSDYFREWTFLEPRESEQEIFLGTCVEGIRVEFDTPGFKNQPIVAMANATGPSAPRTNVARSGLETAHLDEMLERVYSMYCEHVESELQELHHKRGFSLTWATRESQYLLDALLPKPEDPYDVVYYRDSRDEPLNTKLLTGAVMRLPVYLLEESKIRQAVSAEHLHRTSAFWTIDCDFVTSAESLLRQVQTRASLSDLVSALSADTFELPVEPLLSYLPTSGHLRDLAFRNKEVDTIRIQADHRRVDLRWAQTESVARWRVMPESILEPSSWRSRDDYRALLRYLDTQPTRRNRWSPADFRKIKVGCEGVNVVGATGEVAVRAFGTYYLLPGTPMAAYLASWIERYQNDNTLALPLLAIMSVFKMWLDFGASPSQRNGSFAEWPLAVRERVEAVVDQRELLELVNATPWKIFNPAVWRRDYE